MFQVTGLKILGSVDTHIFFYLFFSEKNINLAVKIVSNILKKAKGRKFEKE